MPTALFIEEQEALHEKKYDQLHKHKHMKDIAVEMMTNYKGDLQEKNEQ